MVTIDGFFAGPNGETDWHKYDEEMSANSIRLMKSLGLVIFGRLTYDLMAGYWPTPKGIQSEPAVADIMNNIPKIVFSKTLRNVKDGPVWKNVTVLSDLRADDINKIKEQKGKDIAILGSGTIVRQLTNLGLIDEYRLILNPIVLETGKPLFKDYPDLRLLGIRSFRNGNVLLTYKPGRSIKIIKGKTDKKVKPIAVAVGR